MTRDEFIKSAAHSGYCNKKDAEAYCNRYQKDIYTDEDYIEVTRFVYDRRWNRFVELNGGWTPLAYF